MYSVYDGGRKYIVCLDSRTCSWRRFQIDEITYQHVIAILKSKHTNNMKPYFSKYYHLETLIKMYEVLMVPMPSKKELILPQKIHDKIILSPKYKRPLERPKKEKQEIK